MDRLGLNPIVLLNKEKSMPPYCPTEKSFLRLIYIQDHRYAGGLWMKPGNRPSINPLAEEKED